MQGRVAADDGEGGRQTWLATQESKHTHRGLSKTGRLTRAWEEKSVRCRGSSGLSNSSWGRPYTTPRGAPGSDSGTTMLRARPEGRPPAAERRGREDPAPVGLGHWPDVSGSDRIVPPRVCRVGTAARLSGPLGSDPSVMLVRFEPRPSANDRMRLHRREVPCPFLRGRPGSVASQPIGPHAALVPARPGTMHPRSLEEGRRPCVRGLELHRQLPLVRGHRLYAPVRIQHHR